MKNFQIIFHWKLSSIFCTFLSKMHEGKRERVHRGNKRTFASLFHISSHVPVFHQNTNPLAKKSRKTALSHTLVSVYPLSILVCILAQVFSWTPGDFSYSCKLSYSFRTIFFICYIKNVGFFSGNIFKLSSL